MLHSELLVNAYHSLSSALLFGFPVLAIFVTVLYFFKIQAIRKKRRMTIKGLRELIDSRDIDKYLPPGRVVVQAGARFEDLKKEAKIDPKLLLALDYLLKKYRKLSADRRRFLAYLLIFIFLSVFMLALSVIALFVSPWLGHGQRITVMILEFIPSLFAFAFLVYLVVKMLGWPERDGEAHESDSQNSQTRSEPESKP